MKLKQIEAILKAEKTIIVAETPECQWLGNGAVFYPVYNLPKLTCENIFTMFDIAEDKRDKFYFKETVIPEHYNLADGDESEQILDRGKIAMYADGRTLEPLKTSQGLVFINSRYLKPFAGIDGGYELYERTDASGKSYIVAKSGFMLLGIILPYDLVSKEFIATLEEFVSLSRVALFNKQQREAENAVEQLTIGTEGDNGDM